MCIVQQLVWYLAIWLFFKRWVGFNVYFINMMNKFLILLLTKLMKVMSGIIVFDTNTYRQLGLNFSKHIDYVNLRVFCTSSGYALAISEIVALEFTDYFKREVIEERISEFQKSLKYLTAIPSFETIQVLKLDGAKKKALSKFKSKLNLGTFTISYEKTDVKKLAEFLVENKFLKLKDNARDYLIWNSLIEYLAKNLGNTVNFISCDKIFTNNKKLREGINEKILNRLKIYETISDFLFHHEFKIDFITLSYLEKVIDYKKVVANIFKDTISMFSYTMNKASNYYTMNKATKFYGKYDLCSKEILVQEIIKYYTYQDPNDKKYKFLAQLVIKPSVSFNVFPVCESDEKTDWRNLDEKGNPKFEENIFILIGGIIDMENKNIAQQYIVKTTYDYDAWNAGVFKSHNY